MVTPLEVKGWIWLLHMWFWVIFVVGIVEKCHLIAGWLVIVRRLVQIMVNLVGVPAALWLSNQQRGLRRRVGTQRNGAVVGVEVNGACYSFCLGFGDI